MATEYSKGTNVNWDMLSIREASFIEDFYMKTKLKIPHYIYILLLVETMVFQQDWVKYDIHFLNWYHLFSVCEHFNCMCESHVPMGKCSCAMLT